MNLPVAFSIASAFLAFCFIVTAPFNRRPSIPLWSFALGMLGLAVEQVLSALSILSVNPLELSHYLQWKLFATSTLPGFWLLFAFSYSRGNVKAHLKRRWLPIASAFVIPISAAIIGRDNLAKLVPDPDRPFEWLVTLGGYGFIIHLCLLMAMIASLVGLERTYRASIGTMRWKIKFMLYGMGTLFAARFFTSSQIILDQAIDPGLEITNSVALLVCCLLAGRSILRKGSFDIDLYPSRTIISGSLVISLAGAYLIIVGVLSKIVSRFGGDQAFAIQTFLVLVALVGLGLLIQSDRARQLVRRFVSRNFSRPLFDYRTLWLNVAAAASQSVREKEICEAMTKLLSNLFDAKLINIWLRDSSSPHFILTATSDQQTGQSSIHEPLLDTELSNKLLETPDPSILDELKGVWACAIKDANPSSFKKGGHRVLIPLTGQSRAIGFIVLGDRTNTLKFTQQEFDTLRCIADHITGSLLSAALTRKLEQSKEIEAFQTMATFFVHDLKNAASTLNLMLKNMPLHWDNPEFRNDALRGLGNTSQRIADLINRLSQVRHELEIEPRNLNLAELARKAISEWQCPNHIKFETQFDAEPTVAADEKRAKSVILNLLINAAEATQGDGKMSLVLESSSGEALLSVHDNGSGMSKEFIHSSLFRPFKTTKKSGLGIGMFQSKMVMEAHGGSIEVQSKEGKGSVLTLRFPLISKS